MFQTVTDVPSLNGLGNFDSLTQRQIVAGLTGSNPDLAGLVEVAGVLASSEILMTRSDIVHPLEILDNATCASMG